MDLRRTTATGPLRTGKSVEFSSFRKVVVDQRHLIEFLGVLSF